MGINVLKQNRDFFSAFYRAAFLFLIFLIFGLLTYNYTTVSGDLGEYVNNALRVYNGEIPYKDFWLLFPPGEVYLPAFLYKIFGLNVNVILILWVVISALIGAVSFVLGKVLFCVKNGGNILSFLMAILMFFNGLLHIHFLLLLVATIFFIQFLKKETFNWFNLNLIFSGIFIGLAFYFRFFEVAAYAVAAGMTLILNLTWKKVPFYRLLKIIAVFGCAVILPVLILYLPSFKYLELFFKSVVVDSLKHGTSMNLPYFGDIKHALKDLIGYNGAGGFTVYRLVVFLRTTVLYLLPFVVLLTGVWRLFRRNVKKFDKALIFFLILWVLFEFPKALGRSDVSHLAHAVSPAIILILLLFAKFERWFLKVFFGGFLTALFLQMPIRIYDTVKILNIPHYEVKTDYGLLMLDNEKEALTIRQIFKFIDYHSKKGDYIFVTSWYSPAFYALTNRRNSTYYDSLIDLVAQPSDEKQKLVCNQLLNVKLIIHNSYWKFDDKDNLKFNKTNPILENCIRDNFKLMETYKDYDLYLP